MMKLLKILLVVTVLAVVIVVGGIAAFISFADPNDFKETIAEKVKAATGRELTLAGDLQWAFWPKIRIDAGPMMLSNAPGFGDEPFLSAEAFQIAVATLPLLRKQVEMDTVKLHGATINLAANADGVTNWADLSGGEADKGGSGDVAAIALGGVDIQNAKITWKNGATGQNVAISELNVATGALTFGEPIDFELSLTAVANEPALDSDVALKGTVAYDLSAETYTVLPLDLEIVMRGKHLPNGSATIKTNAIVDVDMKAGIANIDQITLDGLGTKLTGNIVATDIRSDAPGGRGAIDLQGRDLAAVFKALDLPVAKQIAGLKERSFNIQTKFDANMQSGVVDVPNLQGSMLGADLNAQLNVTRANTDKPHAKGSLTTGGPDLPALLAVFGQLQGMEAKTLDGLVGSLRRTKDRSFKLETNFDADMQSGRINLPTLEAKLLGNSISGNVTSAGDDATLTGNLKASGPDLPSLLAIAATFQGPDSGLHEMSKSLSSSPNKAFSLQSKFSSNANNGLIDLPELSAKGLGLTIDGRLKGQNMDKDNGTIDGRLNVAGGKDIGPLLTALGQKDLAKSIKALTIEAGLSGTMSDMTLSPLKVVSKVQGAGTKAPLDLTLTTGSARANLDKETLTVKELSLRGLGMNITGNLDATNIKSDLAYKGRLNVPNFNLRRVMANLNQKLPPMANPKALTKFGMNADLSGTKTSIALRKFNLLLDQSVLKGDLTIASFDGPDVSFGLGIDQINADGYLPPKAKGNPRPVTPETAAAGAAQLPLETLRKLKVKGDLLIGKLQISGAKMQNVKFSINAKGGIINMNPVAASLYNGTYKGGISLDATKKVPSVGFNTVLAGVNIEPLLFDMTGDRSLAGVANLNANLRASGANGDLMKKSLSGPAKFLVQNGVYRGIDVANMLAQLEVMIESKRPGNLQKGGETRFQTLGGTINFANGVGANNDLLMDGSGFKITGKGVVADLRNDTMKYDAKVSVDSSSAQRGESNYNLGGYTVPIRCRGKLGADACKPDVGDIVGEIAKSSIKKEVGKQLEKAIGGDAGKALKDLFKF